MSPVSRTTTPVCQFTESTAPPPPKSAISCAVVFLSVPASFIKTSSVPAREDLRLLLDIAVGSTVKAHDQVTSPV